MKLQIQTPKKALKPFLKQKPLRSEIDIFKAHLITLLDKINIIEQQPKDETEEHLKNNIRDFLRDTYYKDTNAINTKDKKDLVIHLTKETSSNVGVIIEAKRPTNINEMVSEKNANKKALHELILYYLNERITNNNNELKQLVITNINEWYIIDSNVFDKVIYKPNFIKLYTNKVNDKKDNPWFYEEVAKLIEKTDAELPCVYFNIKNYEKALKNDSKTDDKELIDLYKILSPLHLLKVAANNDSNKLDKPFYNELLHIIGLEEVKEAGKNIIRRKQTDVNKASFIEMTINKLKTKGIHKVKDVSNYGDTTDEKHFAIALELCITWINRILFLKLLEGQLLNYHKGNKDYCFLNTKTIHDFDELFKLFHQVLAVNIKDRDADIQSKYKLVPYLNSSLFEISELEDETITIDSLDNTEILAFSSNTILKEHKKKAKGLATLEYLFQFLNAYDFASEGEEDIQEENKTIINASVLGTVFEKINGYKDGSIYTPAFITMYMCRQSIRQAVIDKFNEVKGWNVKDFIELENEIKDRTEANKIINNLKICDPAVGSGHFLVSALNELIAIKSELNILMDEQGKTLKDYEIKINNDELIITDENDKPFAYNPLNKESNRVQKTLFNEKRELIENCLFGVDINPNSVKICRLRLWIELLKNAYYKEDTNYTELETLPNIDINIKCGNSLISRFKLNDDLSKALKSIKYDIKAYRDFVQDYKNERNRDTKRALQLLIDTIKNDFRTEIFSQDPKRKKFISKTDELNNLLKQTLLFELSAKEKKVKKEQQKKLENEVAKLADEIGEIKNNVIYKNAFEWRFEFPEVLNDKGEFEGFDVVIGNPPYGADFSNTLKEYYKEAYSHIHIRTPESFNYFVSRFIEIGKIKSNISFIIPSSFLNQIEFEKTRKYLLDNFTLNELLNLGDNVFVGIAAPTCIIAINKNNSNTNFLYADLTKISREKLANEMNSVDEFLNTNTFKSNTGYNFINSKNKKLIDKCYQNNLTLKDIAEDVATGISSGLDKAYVYTKDVIKEKQFEEVGLKKIVIGGEINRYCIEPKSTKSICYVTNETEISKIPNIYQELLLYRNKLELRREAANGSIKWYSLNWPRRQKLFEEPKILIRQTANKIIAAYDSDKWYCLKSGLIVQLPQNSSITYNYLLALLNSTLMDFLYRDLVNEDVRIFPEVKPIQLFKLPIKIADETIQTKVADIVDKIITAKQQNQPTTTLENQIDELVYKLYDLTDDEIKIVEKN